MAHRLSQQYVNAHPVPLRTGATPGEVSTPCEFIAVVPVVVVVPLVWCLLVRAQLELLAFFHGAAGVRWVWLGEQYRYGHSHWSHALLTPAASFALYVQFLVITILSVVARLIVHRWMRETMRSYD